MHLSVDGSSASRPEGSDNLTYTGTSHCKRLAATQTNGYAACHQATRRCHSVCNQNERPSPGGGAAWGERAGAPRRMPGGLPAR